MKRFEDIIDHPYPFKSAFPKMERAERAAQFSPFAALTGYDEAIKEEAREVEEKSELSQDRLEEVDQMLRLLKRGDRIRLTYFERDEKKEGGAYKEISATVKGKDSVFALLLLEGGEKIPFEDLYQIEYE